MQTPVTTGPPHVPLRHSRWPVHKTPRWLLLAGVLVLAAAVLVGLAHRPSQAERATDMNGFLRDMTTDIQSCAGGVRESLFAMREIESGASHDLPTAIGIATYGASNCSPANNELLDVVPGHGRDNLQHELELGDAAVTSARPGEMVRATLAALDRVKPPSGVARRPTWEDAFAAALESIGLSAS